MKTQTLFTPHFDELSTKEQNAVRCAVSLGEEFGYGNIIAHLATAWAVKLRAEGLAEATAINHVQGRAPYRLPKMGET